MDNAERFDDETAGLDTRAVQSVAGCQSTRSIIAAAMIVSTAEITTPAPAQCQNANIASQRFASVRRSSFVTPPEQHGAAAALGAIERL
jgi:hypothetical protein